MNIATQTQPREKKQDRRTLESHGIGFYMTINEKAEGSLDLVKCLNEQPEVVYFERTSEGSYFIVGEEKKIREICEDFTDCVMKLEPVE